MRRQPDVAQLCTYITGRDVRVSYGRPFGTHGGRGKNCSFHSSSHCNVIKVRLRFIDIQLTYTTRLLNARVTCISHKLASPSIAYYTKIRVMRCVSLYVTCGNVHANRFGFEIYWSDVKKCVYFRLLMIRHARFKSGCFG